MYSWWQYTFVLFVAIVTYTSSGKNVYASGVEEITESLEVTICLTEVIFYEFLLKYGEAMASTFPIYVYDTCR